MINLAFGKNLEKVISETDFEIVKTLSVMAEQDPSERVRDSAKLALQRKYDGVINGTFCVENSIYIRVLIGNTIIPYYVCEKEPYEFSIAKIEDDFFKKE